MEELIRDYIEEMEGRAEDCKAAGYANEMKILRTIILTLRTMLSKITLPDED